jgi:hypothetical protein
LRIASRVGSHRATLNGGEAIARAKSQALYQRKQQPLAAELLALAMLWAILGRAGTVGVLAAGSTRTRAATHNAPFAQLESLTAEQPWSGHISQGKYCSD